MVKTFFLISVFMFGGILCLNCATNTTKNIAFEKSIADEYDVYVAVLKKDTKEFIVLDKTNIDWISPNMVVEKQNAGLKVDFVAKNERVVSIEKRFPTKKNYWIVNEGELGEFLRKHGTFPDMYQFSRVGFSDDGQQAVVYVSMNCGALCGQGAIYLLAREDGRWKIIKVDEVWVS